MISLLQRVSSSKVCIEGETVAEIDHGILALIGIHQHDDEATVISMVDKILCYRIFEDNQGKMNLSLQDTRGSLLIAPQFTLVADTKKGKRPSFSTAADPAHGRKLFQSTIRYAQQSGVRLEHGVFGANMQVHLTNDGPVTLILKS